MAEHFDISAFLNLLEVLAKTAGPSLGESPRRKCIEDVLSNNHIAYSVDQAGNLWVQYGHGDWEDSVVFDAHMDVVQEGYAVTFDRKENLVTGMGVADNLTAVALLVLYAVHLNRIKPSFVRPLYFLFSTGEEGNGNLKGIRQVVSDYISPPFAFVSFDLSFEEYSIAGLGSVRYRAEISCPGGHSWSDYGIPSAVEKMMAFLMSLKDEVQNFASPLNNDISFNIGTIEGGEGINSIARKAVATFEFRSPDPNLLDKMDKKVEIAVNKVNSTESCDAVCLLSSRRPAARAVLPERLEPHVVRIFEELGEKTSPVIRSTNINATLTAKWPSICLGLCIGGRFHTHDEFIRIDSIEKGWRVLEKLSQSLLNVKGP